MRERHPMTHTRDQTPSTRWEYCLTPLDDLDALNTLGHQGWEAVGVQGPGLGAFILCKRAIAPTR